jgi:hypothetical protein
MGRLCEVVHFQGPFFYVDMKAMNGAATNPFKLQTTSPAETPLHWQSGECDGTNGRGNGQATDVGEDSSLEANVFLLRMWTIGKCVVVFPTRR